jgi:hypothetical protein
MTKDVRITWTNSENSLNLFGKVFAQNAKVLPGAERKVRESFLGNVFAVLFMIV